MSRLSITPRTALAALVVVTACVAAPIAGTHAQTITTVVGNGIPTFAGDGGLGINASLVAPRGVTFDSCGNLFIADAGNNRIRRVDAITEIISTVAGSGAPSFGGDNGPATGASLRGPQGVALDAAGNLFIGDVNNHRVRRVDAATGIITTVAGNGVAAFSGDGGPAASASLNEPRHVAIDAGGHLFIGDALNHRVRRVDAATGIITTVAGNGIGTFGGDGGPATSASLRIPLDVTFDAGGNLLIADDLNMRIRRVDAVTGIITTVAGNGLSGFSGDGGPATSARLNLAFSVVVDGAGNIFISDLNNARIRRVDAATGIITTVAGNGVNGFGGDGGPATSAALSQAQDLAVDAAGNLFIADVGNNRIRRVGGFIGTAAVANAGTDQTVDEGVLVTLDGSASSGGCLGFSWTQLAGPAVVLSGANGPTPSFTAPSLAGGFGSQTLTFALTVDNGTGPRNDTVDVTVSNVNHPPMADAGPDQLVNEGSAVTLSGEFSFDPDGDTLTYQWIQTGGPAVALSGAGTATPSFTAPVLTGGIGAAVALTFALTVSDGVLSHGDSMTVTVDQVNHRPLADAGLPQTVAGGQAVLLDGSASSDPDNDPITYQWTQVAGPAVALTGASGPTPGFTTPFVGGSVSLGFQLVVNDGALSSLPARVDVTITNGVPRCDLARANPSLLWPPNHAMRAVGIAGVTDPDDDGVVITITGVTQDEPTAGLGDGDTSPDAIVQGASALIRAERSGTGNGRVYRLSFRADDGIGGACTGAVRVDVPKSMKPGDDAVDSGQTFQSTQP